MRHFNHLFSILLIIGLSITIYGNTLNNGFVYDDHDTIVDSSLIQDFHKLPKLLEKDYFVLSGEKTYRPIVTLTYFIDYSLFNNKSWGFHLTNILLHTINGVLLYIFMTVFLQENKDRKKGIWTEINSERHPPYIIKPQLLISLLFITHPIITEAVNAISFREDLLVFLFYLSTLVLYLRIKSANSLSPSIFLLYATSCLLYFMALLSKETAVTLPLTIFCYEWLYADKRDRSYLSAIINRYNLGYIVVTLVYIYLRFFYFYNPLDTGVPAAPLIERLITIPWLLSNYLKIVVFPVYLSAGYVIYPIKSIFSFPFIASFIGVIAALALAAKMRKGAKIITFGILFFIVTLIPVYNIIPISKPFAERYLYLPIMGILILAGISIRLIVETIKLNTKDSNLLILFMLVIITIFSFAVIKRNAIWHDDFSLWSDTVKRQPKSSDAHTSLGTAYCEKGQLDVAFQEFKTSLKINPDDSFAHNGMGYFYYKNGRFDEAVNAYKTAIKLNPNAPIFHFNMGSTYAELGRFDEAIEEYNTVLKLKPDDIDAKTNLEKIRHLRGASIDTD